LSCFNHVLLAILLIHFILYVLSVMMLYKHWWRNNKSFKKQKKQTKTEKRRLTWFVIEWKSDQRKGVWNRIGKSSSRRLMQQKRISFFFYEVCLSVKTKTDSFMQLQIELKNSCQKQRFLTFLKAFPMTKDFSIVYTLDNE
jgi:hypothetical protein